MTELVPAYEGKKPYLFVSYAHKDSAFVLPIIRKMFDRKYRVWYDEGIAPGSEWPKTIADHLNAADAFVIFVSENSLNSPNCENEVIRAKKSGKDITQFSIHSRIHAELKNVRTVYREEDLLASIPGKYVGDGTGYDRSIRSGGSLFSKVVLAAAAVFFLCAVLFLARTDREALYEKTLSLVQEAAGTGAEKILSANSEDLTEIRFADDALSEAVEQTLSQMRTVTLSYADDGTVEDLVNNDPELRELVILNADLSSLEPLQRCRNLETVTLPLSAFPVTFPENPRFEVILR